MSWERSDKKPELVDDGKTYDTEEVGLEDLQLFSAFMVATHADAGGGGYAGPEIEGKLNDSVPDHVPVIARVVVLESRPVGNNWVKNKGHYYVHPMVSSGKVAISKNSAGKWLQANVQAILVPSFDTAKLALGATERTA
ncbi:MAG: hypothetical protein ACKVWV_00775 [Planctomycetota bacterium]